MIFLIEFWFTDPPEKTFMDPRLYFVLKTVFILKICQVNRKG